MQKYQDLKGFFVHAWEMLQLKEWIQGAGTFGL